MLESVAAAAATSETVKFNVGGRIFEVLRTPTLALHPTSVLSQLAEDHDGPEPIFVEANSECFQYILDYHRHRKIHIPRTVSKAQVLREAQTLGLPVADVDILQEGLQACELNNDIMSMTEEASQLTLDGKTQLLASLIRKVIVEKLKKARRPFHISQGDMEEMEGKQLKLSELSFNDFSPMLTYLMQGTSKVTVSKCLQPWCKANGLTATVDRWIPNSNCSPVSSSQISVKVS